MAILVCPECQEQIDVTDQKQGAKIFCAGCGKALTVDRQTSLMDAADAQEAIRRARGRTRGGEKKRTIKCPNCGTALEIAGKDAAAGAQFRCAECGQKIVMAQKPGLAGSDSVTFPTLASDGTLLDMGDTREAWGKKPPKKE